MKVVLMLLMEKDHPDMSTTGLRRSLRAPTSARAAGRNA
jgi:hypothetical protein